MNSRNLWPFLGHLLSPWVWRMAWRDSRTSRQRLMLFCTAIVLGIAALVAIGSFGKNLEQAIEEQAKALLGADLVLTSRQPFSPEQEAFIQSLGGIQSRETDFSSMIYFTKNQSSRLVQVRALSGGFPFYGKLETQPAAAASEFRRQGGALVEESLLIQYHSKAGESIRLGNLTTRVAGGLQKVPGETVAFATIAPRVYVPMADLDQTGLLQKGSLVRYKVHFQFPPSTNVSRWISSLRPKIDRLNLSFDTVEKRKANLGRSMENLNHFLNLVGFVALLLGGVGVASAIHVHIKQKLNTVAVLRCLGCSVGQTFAIYLLQGMALGLLGSLVGAALGITVQTVLPRVVADFLPFTISFAISWPAVAQAMAVGFAICLLFALLPLVSVRRISPLAAIRSSYESHAQNRRDPVQVLVVLLIALGIGLFAVLHTKRWTHGLGFAAGLGLAFALLAGFARGIVRVMKRHVPSALPFVWRQGLANLHRPNNRTVLLMLSLGLGTFLILTLYLTQTTLLTQLLADRQDHQANAVLFDIQADQKDAVASLVRSQHLTIQDEAPIVTMRLHSVKGRAVQKLLAARDPDLPRWVLRREYRSTFREQLRDGEKIIAGQWHGQVQGGNAAIPISVEEEIAGDLKVGLGDELVFDVQGVLITNRVASLRQVDWKRVQPNFFVVFPRGVLEEAPAFYVLVTRVESPEQSAALQRSVVQQFPNVSVIDLTLVLQTLDAILGKVAFVIRFMASFTVLTGLLVLAGAILTGRYQRLQESVLLRTLGASRAQVLNILLVEYACLGALAALTGLVLAVAASWALAAFVFEVRFVPPGWPLAFAVLIVSALTVITGLLASRGILNHPPLAVLRAEG